MKIETVIVGGGIYGCTVAWELARRGVEVMLLEANQIASGASGGLGKRGVRANGRDLRELPLMGLAYELWPTLHEEIGAPTGYARTGHLMLIERERDLAAAPARAWMQARQGIPTRLLTGDEVREIEPQLGERVQAALLCPNDGVADHTATTRGMAQAAQRQGATLREQTTVTQIEQAGSRVSAVITGEGERIEVGESLLILSNSGAPHFIAAQFGVKLPVWSRLPQVVLTAPVTPALPRHLIGHAHRRLAMKAGPDGAVMISGGWEGKWNAQTQRGETQPDQVARNVAEAAAVFSALEGVQVTQAAADRLESDTVDHIPIIDRVPGVENALFATGWAGHGWAISPAVGRMIAEWATSGSRPDLLRPFAYSRFG